MRCLRRPMAILASALLLAVLSAAQVPGASAAEPASHLRLRVQAAPTSYSAADTSHCEPPGYNHCDKLVITATNTGSEPTHGAITLKLTLPPGLSEFEPFFSRLIPAHESEQLEPLSGGAPGTACKQAGQTITCRATTPLQPDQALQLIQTFTVSPTAISGEAMNVSMTSVETPETSTSVQTLIDGSTPFGIGGFEAALSGDDGLAFSLAGSHPYEFTTYFDFDSVFRYTPEGQFNPVTVEDLRDAVVDLPPGLTGSAEAAPKCTELQIGTFGGCPADTRIGYIETEPQSLASINSAIYNMVPERGVAAEFGFDDVLNNPHFIYTEVAPSPGGYILRSTTPEIPQIPLINVNAVFFGNPAARDEASEPAPPLFTMPSNCDGQPLTTGLHVDSWQNRAPDDADGSPDYADPRWAPASSESPPVSGCDGLRFHASLEAAPETNRADSPTGLNVTIKVPQTEGAEELATPPLRKAVITLPAGMSVNPSSANGLQGCSLAQIGVSPSGQPDAAAPSCPAASKIGSVELLTPAVEGDPNLGGALQGEIYLAKQSENPFGSLLALYIVVDDPYTGVLVKIPGEVRADAATGQLETIFDNNPQFPFSELRTHFFGGQRAALRTPSVCGKYTVTSTLTPWSAPQSGASVTPSSSFNITQGCSTSAGAEPDHPGFSAGTLDPLAGAYSPLVLKLTREDGSQELSGLSLSLPEGLIGKLAGIPYCSDAALAAAAASSGAAEQASSSCPPASEVGAVTVGAGAGLEPFYARGRAYLAGPYDGAPLSLAVITPAVAGPFDLGTVVIRNALQVDPETAQITAVSDPIPHILQGIPLDIRSISLEMNRPQFTLNPTNCEKKAINGRLTTVQGQSAPLSNPFQVGGCKSLAFKPKLSLSLKGSTRHAGHPALKAVLSYPKGSNANIARAQVNLPHSEFIDQGNLNKTCTKPVLLAGNCPATSVYGKATAWTPLLEKPLEGPVYLVGGYGYKLPALVAELNGQIKVLLIGKVDSGKNQGIRNTFEAVPDAPVEKFVLELKGGPKYSLLENSENLCAKPQKAIAAFTAQSGKVLDLTPTIANSCKGKGSKHKRGKGKKGKAKKSRKARR